MGSDEATKNSSYAKLLMIVEVTMVKFMVEFMVTVGSAVIPRHIASLVVSPPCCTLRTVRNGHGT
ncbi:MAG TPA: hypothetical protein VMV06_11770 [Acidimicrobiales bacterium]|nr:hypothetical protein [Acidimicrobiales bacterium]